MIEVLKTIQCGGTITIDAIVPNVISTAVTIIKIGIPIALIIFGMLDLGKAVMSNDEKEMKGAQSKFIKRCIYAILVFFIVAIVQFIVGILGKSNGDNTDKKNINSCIHCFINGKCTEVKS